ncbi:MAG: tRNA pseudouridine(13) synthase TruD [Planctomycetota bacterium]|nr:tRNA pseudouridine(13) synthase TruD [Planctomycetota bacterium]
MKLKQRIGDFRVRELLTQGYLCERGRHRVYRVTKRKMTSEEAARVLADEAGVDAGGVSLAGLKDRQAITIQHMSVPGGRSVSLRRKELVIEPVGFAESELSSSFSLGNAFEITVRELERRDISILRRNIPIVRESGLVNYFDDQRFGNLTYDQGWIARDLMQGRHEKALRALLASHSRADSGKALRFKRALDESWGDWRACRDVAGRFGQHHSVFEHLGRTENDFAGAFRHVSSRLRLIHLYAWQSHIWNRAVCQLVRNHVPLPERVVLEGLEGPLATYAKGVPSAFVERSFRLPGDGLDDVDDPEARTLLEDVLARERMVPDDLRIDGVPGFQLKGEDRDLVLLPRHLRVRPARPDPLNRGHSHVQIRFDLPRGSYATLVVKRLMGRSIAESPNRAENTARRGDRRPHSRAPRGRERGGRGA